MEKSLLSFFLVPLPYFICQDLFQYCTELLWQYYTAYLLTTHTQSLTNTICERTAQQQQQECLVSDHLPHPFSSEKLQHTTHEI